MYWIFIVNIAGEFDIAFEYVSKNGTGTGQIAIDIATVDGIPLGETFALTYSGFHNFL